MSNEQNNNTKSLTRSESMKRAWARRKSQSVTEVGWYENPTCLCGCGEPLVRHRNPERQRLFRAGHDARLKFVAAGVLAGEVPEHAKLPNPRTSTLSPDRRARTMLSNMAQTTTSDSFRDIPMAW
jgi:hypothetical protein